MGKPSVEGRVIMLYISRRQLQLNHFMTTMCEPASHATDANAKTAMTKHRHLSHLNNPSKCAMQWIQLLHMTT